jgi:hypothetical protein
MNQLRARRPSDPTKHAHDARRDIATPRELAAQSAARSLAPLEGDDYTERFDVARAGVALWMLEQASGSMTVTVTPAQLIDALRLAPFGDSGLERVDNAIASLVSLGVVEIIERAPHDRYDRRDRITVMVRE